MILPAKDAELTIRLYDLRRDSRTLSLAWRPTRYLCRMLVGDRVKSSGITCSCQASGMVAGG